MVAALAVAQQLHKRGELYLYVDAHAHGNKRGCFFYANALGSDAARQADCPLWTPPPRRPSLLRTF